jgi:hypothetical protein
MSGTTSPRLAEEFEKVTGSEAEVTHAEIREIMKKSRKLPEVHKDSEELPWSVEEELFVHRHDPKRGASWALRQGMVVVVSSASLVLLFARLRNAVTEVLTTDATTHCKYV